MFEELAVPVGNYRVKISVILTVVKILFSLQNGKRIGTRRYTIYRIYCIQYIYSIQYINYTVYSIYIIQYTVYILYSIQYIYYTVYSIQYIYGIQNNHFSVYFIPHLIGTVFKLWKNCTVECLFFCHFEVRIGF